MANTFMIAPIAGAIGGMWIGAAGGWEDARGRSVARRLASAVLGMLGYGFGGLVIVGMIGIPFDSCLYILVDALGTVRVEGWSLWLAAKTAVSLPFVVAYPALIFREVEKHI